MIMKRSILLLVAAAGLIFSSCKSLNKSQKGVLIGAGAGGAVGAGVGKIAGNTALGAIIGATVGGAAGGIIGKRMDDKAKELEKIKEAEVQRVGEGINLTFKSGVLFATDSYELNSAARQTLAKVTDVLVKNDDVNILIEGHTDNTGTDAYNQTLSERRARAVSDFLVAQGIKSARLKTTGYGKTQPKVSNDTEEGRATNRRVEFAIYANEQFKESAKSQGGS